MQYKPAAILLLLVLAVAVLTPFALDASDAAECEGNPRPKASTTVLPQGHLFTLHLEEDSERLEFSTAVASRHFSLAPVERRLSFRGRLWHQDDGRELLDYSLEYQRFVVSDNGKDLRTANWSGSAYVEDGRKVTIVAGPSYAFAVEIEGL